MISGKYGPKENSVMTCDRFITALRVSNNSPSRRTEPSRLTLVVDVLVAGISMSESCDVQVSGDPLRRDGAENAASTPVRLVVVRRLEAVFSTKEESVEETAGATRLRDSLAGGERCSVRFQSGCLANIEFRAISAETVAEVKAITNGVPEVDAKV